MCLILDANCYGDFKNDKNYLKPIWDWLNRGNNRLVYSQVGKFQKEWRKWLTQERKGSPTPIKLMAQLETDNKLKKVDPNIVENEIKRLRNKRLKSNDEHIVALGRVGISGKPRILVTKDKNLKEDFQKHVQNGKLYSTRKGNEKDNERLLSRYKCP